MTTPPAEGTSRLVRGHASIDFNETDAEDKPPQLEETGSVPPPFPSLTHTPPTRTVTPIVSRDTEHQKTNDQNIEENFEQPQLPTVKTDGAIGEKEATEDGSSCIGHSTRTLEVAEQTQVLHVETDIIHVSDPVSATAHGMESGQRPKTLVGVPGEDGSRIGHSTRTGEDGSSGTGKTGHSTRTKRKHKTVTRKRQHGEWRLVCGNLLLYMYMHRPHVITN
jgi:hypothetical protein